MSAMDLRVGNKYRIGRKIGSGSFGDIYLGECTLYTFPNARSQSYQSHNCKNHLSLRINCAAPTPYPAAPQLLYTTAPTSCLCNGSHSRASHLLFATQTMLYTLFSFQCLTLICSKYPLLHRFQYC
jgi:hypothetical protein